MHTPLHLFGFDRPFGLSELGRLTRELFEVVVTFWRGSSSDGHGEASNESIRYHPWKPILWKSVSVMEGVVMTLDVKAQTGSRSHFRLMKSLQPSLKDCLRNLFLGHEVNDNGSGWKLPITGDLIVESGCWQQHPSARCPARSFSRAEKEKAERKYPISWRKKTKDDA